jgi:hypothetical protein
MFRTYEELHGCKEQSLLWYIHFFIHTTISINHLLTIAHQIYALNTGSFEFYFERINILSLMKKIHMKEGDMSEIYKCRLYFRNFKNVVKEDVALVKQFPSIIDTFEKNLPVRQLSFKIVNFYKAVQI